MGMVSRSMSIRCRTSRLRCSISVLMVGRVICLAAWMMILVRRMGLRVLSLIMKRCRVGLVSHYIIVDNSATSGSAYPDAPSEKAVYNPSGFQIISPGYDGDFGVGGEYPENGILDYDPDPTGARAQGFIYERDNITNFRNGRLQ